MSGDERLELEELEDSRPLSEVTTGPSPLELEVLEDSRPLVEVTAAPSPRVQEGERPLSERTTGPAPAEPEPETAPASPRASVAGRPSRLPPGLQVGENYRILRLLGEGGMGTVYLARDELLVRDVAIKLVRRDRLGDPAALERFAAEARAMARLRHPHVLGVHALHEHAGRPYLVMDYVPGMTLAQLMRERGTRLLPEEALVVLDGVCRGVAALHAAGLVHGDLKPSNVLIGSGFRVVVADLGLARRLGLPGGAWATPGYSAPEALETAPPPEDLARRIDVYSVGAMAYELFTGQLPFPTAAEWTAAQETRQPPPAPSTLRPELGTAIDEPILASLAWSPESRLDSVDVLRRTLLRAMTARRPASAGHLRILVVDDDPAYATLASKFLARAFPGAQVEAAEDGVRALEACARARPDLVVTDLDMPDMNGMELTAALRADPATSSVPVIVASAIGGATDWALLGRLGANAFLGKPYDAAQLELLARMLVQ